jgi:hypothetical protein
MSDVFGIVANVISDKVLRSGAKVWIIYVNGDASCPRVTGLSKGGGRQCVKYTHFKRLTNFRAKWIPEHMRGASEQWHPIYQYDTKAKAQAHADVLNRMWEGVRSFRRDGTLIRDGITEGEAFRRASERSVMGHD